MDAKTFYEQIAPELDPGGFKLYFTAQRLTGFELYKQFPYEDSRGMFEMMNGHQLMRYLLADQFHAVRWEIVPGTCYERAVLLPIDRTTPSYRAFEQKLYTAVLQTIDTTAPAYQQFERRLYETLMQNCHLNPLEHEQAARVTQKQRRRNGRNSR